MVDSNVGIDIGNVLLNIASIVVSTALPLLLFRYFRNTDKKRDDMAREEKQSLDRNAKEIKEITKESAEKQREFTLSIIDKMEKKYEGLLLRVENEIRQEKEVAHKKIVLDFKEDLDIKTRELLGKIDGIVEKQGEMRKNQEVMINNLVHRADMVNGNVATIRTEILDLQEDIDEIYEKVNDRMMTTKAKREKKRKRSSRRTDIALKALSDEEKKKILT